MKAGGNYADAFIEGPARWLTREQVGRLLATVAGHPRDRLLLTLIYRYGLRAKEAVGLNCADLMDDGTIHIRRLKRGRPAYYPIWPEVAEIIEMSWWQTRLKATEGLFQSNPLFTWGATERRLGYGGVRLVFARRCREAGVLLLRGLGVHSLRHSIAVHLLDANCTLEFVQHLLGHRTIQATQIYARVSAEKVRAEFARADLSGRLATAEGGGLPPEKYPKKA